METGRTVEVSRQLRRKSTLTLTEVTRHYTLHNLKREISLSTIGPGVAYSPSVSTLSHFRTLANSRSRTTPSSVVLRVEKVSPEGNIVTVTSQISSTSETSKTGVTRGLPLS